MRESTNEDFAFLLYHVWSGGEIKLSERELRDKLRAAFPLSDELEPLLAQMRAGEPMPDWLETAKAAFFERCPTVEFVKPGHDSFLWQATLYCEWHITEYLKIRQEPEQYPFELERQQKRLARQTDPSKPESAGPIRALKGYYLEHEQDRAWGYGEPEIQAYACWLYCEWLKGQIKALEAPATPPPAQEPPKNPPRPVFSPEAKKLILEKLAPMLEPPGPEQLPGLLEGTEPPAPLVFRGGASQLVKLLFEETKWGQGREGCTRKGFWQWLSRNLRWTDPATGKAKELKENTFNEALKNPDDRKQRR